MARDNIGYYIYQKLRGLKVLIEISRSYLVSYEDQAYQTETER